MEFVHKFLKSRNAVKVATTLTLFFVGLEYILLSILEFSIVKDILSFDNYTLFRIWYLLIGVLVGFVAFASYKQNKALVDESLKKAKDKVVAETKEVTSKVSEEITEEPKPKKSSSKTKSKK
jgi:uncharacterized membrane protein YuzA (DUF378 family)